MHSDLAFHVLIRLLGAAHSAVVADARDGGRPVPVPIVSVTEIKSALGDTTPLADPAVVAGVKTGSATGNK